MTKTKETAHGEELEDVYTIITKRMLLLYERLNLTGVCIALPRTMTFLFGHIASWLPELIQRFHQTFHPGYSNLMHKMWSIIADYVGALSAQLGNVS